MERQTLSPAAPLTRLAELEQRLCSMIEIGKAMSSEHQVDRLLAVILDNAQLVASADAASIYVVSARDSLNRPSQLRFKLTRNHSVEFDWSEVSMPADRQSIAGFVALEGRSVSIDNVRALPPDAPFRYDNSFDARIGYRTISILCAPICNLQGEVIGVVQLINKKLDPTRKLESSDDLATQVVGFDLSCQQLIEAFSGQAGVCLQNAILFDEIATLFDAFVHASVDAIEQRDPPTSGHSRRVAALTMALAEAVARATDGAFAGVSFTNNQLRELRYAALLHDFGKIAVRERVLVKEAKLERSRMAVIEARIAAAIQAELAADLREKLLACTGQQSSELPSHTHDDVIATLRNAWLAVQNSNLPTPLDPITLAELQHLSTLTYCPVDGGDARPLLEPGELAALGVRAGTLDDEELREMRNHVAYGHRYLSQIPWGSSLSGVPSIAAGHHERLDGSGYPKALRAADISIQSRMIAITDVFDALTANDRPYRRAMPIRDALGVLAGQASCGWLDRDLVRLFSDERVWEQSGIGDFLNAPPSYAPPERLVSSAEQSLLPPSIAGNR